LLNRQTELGFRPKVLYLDKGFCNGKIIAYLQDEARLPAIIACPIRGKKGQGGTRALCRGRKAYRTRYTFTDSTTTDLAVVPSLNATPKRASRSEPGWSMSSSIWIGLPRRFNIAIAIASALSLPTVNSVSYALIPTRAIRPCASFSWLWHYS